MRHTKSQDLSQVNLNMPKKEASNLAVAEIADRTAYDVRYADKLSNRFRLEVERQIRTIRFNG